MSKYIGSEDEWWQEAIKGFGWPEEGSRDLGTIEDLYQAFKVRLMAELHVEMPGDGMTLYGRLNARERS